MDITPKCTACEKMRKYILSFEYLSIIGILAFMSLYRILCHNFWKFQMNKDAQKDSPKDFMPRKIQDFGDNLKVMEYATFWDLQLGLNCLFQSHMQTQFSKKKLCGDRWKNYLGLYYFPCFKCYTLVEAPRCKQNGIL